MSDPPNALNIIIKRICQKFRHHHVPGQRHRLKRLDHEPAPSPEDEHGPSSLIGKAWWQLFSGKTNNTKTGNNTKTEKLERVTTSITGAIRTRGEKWHPFSFKGGLLDIGENVDEVADHDIPDVDLD